MSSASLPGKSASPPREALSSEATLFIHDAPSTTPHPRRPIHDAPSTTPRRLLNSRICRHRGYTKYHPHWRAKQKRRIFFAAEPLGLSVGGDWYARPVLSVRDAATALEFYTSQLGFKEDWRFEEDGHLRIVQVSRQRCDLILSDQWPEQAGRGLMFISLDASDFDLTKQAWANRGVEVKSGWWGYDLLVVEDLDGNRLWFPHPDA